MTAMPPLAVRGRHAPRRTPRDMPRQLLRHPLRDLPARPGTVYLVGAGPGDPELITVRGHRLLAAADVVVYDRLVGPELLDLVPAAAERVFAGKAAGIAALEQAEIERLLIARARRGLVVVRLKGGDPFVFGRGGEEALSLARAGVPYEVVPAVSAALGVPARADIPLTHRGVAASFAVVTAQRMTGEEDHDWAALARIDTLVVMMGVAALERITGALLRHGRAASTPAAIIERGTLEGERVLSARLDTVAAVARAAGIEAPATLVIGAVAALRQTLETARQAASTRIAATPADVPCACHFDLPTEPQAQTPTGGPADVR